MYYGILRLVAVGVKYRLYDADVANYPDDWIIRFSILMFSVFIFLHEFVFYLAAVLPVLASIVYGLLVQPDSKVNFYGSKLKTGLILKLMGVVSIFLLIFNFNMMLKYTLSLWMVSMGWAKCAVGLVWWVKWQSRQSCTARRAHMPYLFQFNPLYI